MTKTMLIDAANPEEIRVCVLQGGKVEDFDFESAARKPIRGNIYLARVTRVEPSLQAAFVEFGGNRHGFLAFNEIHPDYYQIPISDRQLLQAADAEEAALVAALNLTDSGEDALDEIDAEFGDDHGNTRERTHEHTNRESDSNTPVAEAGVSDLTGDDGVELPEIGPSGDDTEDSAAIGESADDESVMEIIEAGSDDVDENPALDDEDGDEADDSARPARARTPLDESLAKLSRAQLIEKYKDARRKRARLLRNYKIQEVVKRRQILLVQAVKEERGNKGAALTTYLSLAGRYCVLMPNTARGGGISRKIPVAADRKRLRRIVDGLDVPTGMGLIIRTAGAKRTKAEIKRDYEYLIRLWENIRTLTLKSMAPCLIYEEASLIKRAIRDLYDKDIGNVLVEGDGGYREAKDFMKMLMPSHSKNVQPYKEKTPLFLQHNVESQLDAMYRPTVRLKSGGYIVINQTEALIAIDVNSGKSTRERNIEQTALRTNLEAADEAARQCRLRDLAGLIVIDFIDMEEGRNNRAVEKRLKDALRADRARIQLGRISGFGLLEMSRQRRRSGIIDGTTHMCPTCGGAGAVRSHEMAALRILRSTENEALSSKAGNLQVKAALDVTLYILNHKREWLRRIETDYGVTVELVADSAKAGDNFEIEKTGTRIEGLAVAEVVRADTTETIEPEIEAFETLADDDKLEDSDEIAEHSGEDTTGKRRRRRRRKRRDDGGEQVTAERASTGDTEDNQAGAAAADEDAPGDEEQPQDGEERPRKRRRRGRRGGRRGRRPDEMEADNRATTDATANGVTFEGEQPSLDWPEEEPPAPSRQVDHEPSNPSKALPEPSEPARLDAGEEAIEAGNAPQPDAPPPDFQESPTPAAAQSDPEKPARKGWWSRALGGQ
jgi:ribonuclease E